MRTPSQKDLVTFPGLFEEIEQFIAEESARLRLTGATVACTALAGMLLVWIS